MKITSLLMVLLFSIGSIWAQVPGPNLNEGFEDGVIPDNWTIVNADGGTKVWNAQTTNPHTGLYSARVQYETSSLSNDDWLITPPLYVTSATTDEISFWMRTYNATSSDPWEVLVSTTNTSPSSFTMIDSGDGMLGEYVQKTYSLDEYGDAVVYVAIRSIGSYDWYVYVDDFTGPPMMVPTCPKPTGLTAANPTVSSIELGWTPGNTETMWDVLYGAAGFDPYTEGTLVEGIESNPYVLENLISSSVYQYYVRAVCGEDEVSQWAGPKLFNTACASVSLPLIEQFTFVTTPALPLCWSFIIANTTSTLPNVQTSTLYPVSPPNSVKLYNSSADTAEILLITPMIADPLAGNRVMFSARGGTNYSLLVGTIADPTDPATFTLLAEVFPPGTHAPFQVSLADYTGTDHYIAFKHGNMGKTQTIYIDDIVIEELPDCIEPIELTVSNITNNTALLGWTSQGDETTWDIVYGAPGFDPETGGTTVAGVTTNPYTLAGLTPATTYEFYVRADCGSNAVSTWSGPTIFTMLCDAFELPFIENFDGATTGSYPLCWSKAGLIATNWTISNTTNALGTAPEFRFGYSPSFTGEALAVSPVINTTGETSLAIEFKQYYDDYAVPFTFGMKTTSDGITWNTVYEVVDPVGNIGPETVLISVENEDVGSSTFQFAFFVNGYTFNMNNWYMDDIHVFVPQVGSLEGTVTEATRGPIEGALITAGDYQTYTDASGYYLLENMMTGTYDVTCTAAGFFPVTVEDVEILANQTITQDFTLGFSTISVTPESLTQNIFPGETATQTLTISNLEGTEPLTWSAQIELLEPSKFSFLNTKQEKMKPNASVDETDPKPAHGNPVQTDAMYDLLGSFPVFDVGGTYSVATDGNFIYTGRWNLNQYDKYDLAGNHIESFSIPGAGLTRDLTYDGQYFYGSPNSDLIYQMDFESKTLVSTIVASGNSIRGITYDADNDAFWVTGASFAGPLRLISRTGTVLQTVTTTFTGMSGLTYDNVSPDGPYLWAYTPADGTGTHIINKISIASGSTVESFNLSGLGLPFLTTGSGGGLCLTNQVVPGKWAFMGVAQNELVWILELANSQTWLSMDITNGTVNPGESTDVTMTFDAGDLPLGTYLANININHNGQELTDGTVTVPVTMIVSEPGAPLPPYNPVPADGATMVSLQPILSWTNGAGTAEVQVEIRTAAGPFGTTLYKSNWFTGSSLNLADVPLTLQPEQQYSWQVTVRNSIATVRGPRWTFTTGSDTPPVLDPPTNLQAVVEDFTNVHLTWDAPTGGSGGELFELSYHLNTPENAYIQLWDYVYGVVYDVSGFTNVTIEKADYYHASWGIYGTWDFKLHVVDWNTHTLIYSTPVLQTTGDDKWEVNIPLGSIPESGLVGIFLQPMGNAANDAFPDLSSDDNATTTSSFFGPIGDFSNLNPGTIGNFLMDLWIMAEPLDGGERVLVQAPIIEGAATTSHQSKAAHGNINTPIAPFEYIGANRALTGYNVYRDGALLASTDASTTEYDDLNLEAGTYSYTVTAVYTEGESEAADPVTVEIQSSYGIISGHASDELSRGPVAGATITAEPGDYTATTNVNGFYELEVPAGNYLVTAAKTGYITQTADVVVVANQTTTHDFQLEFAGPILLYADGGIGEIKLGWTGNPAAPDGNAARYSVTNMEYKNNVALIDKEEQAHGTTSEVPKATSGREVGDHCDNPIVLDVTSFPVVDTNTTCGRGNTYSETCLGNYDGGEDIVYQFTLTEAKTLKLTLTTATTWTGMLITQECPISTNCVTFITGSTGNKVITTALEAGTYYVMMDTWPTPNCIDELVFTIDEFIPEPGEICATALDYGNVNDDPELGAIVPSGAVWYSFTADQNYGSVDVSLCGSSFDTKLEVWYNCGDAAYAYYNDDSPACNTKAAQSFITTGPMQAGQTWYAKVYGYSTNAGDYILEITGTEACNLEMPAGAIAEGEPCIENEGDDVTNGGCNMDEPLFTTINCGDVIWGSSSTYLVGTSKRRDTDWYQLEITEPKTVTFSVTAEFPSVAGIIEQTVPGVAGCENITGSIFPAATADPCEEASVTATLIPGTYYFFVGISVFEGYPCGMSNNYIAELTCEDAFVTYYDVFRDDAFLAQTYLETYTDTDVQPDVEYCYTVRQFIEPGVVTPQSNELCASVLCGEGCDYTMTLTDSYGDGWNGASFTIMQGETEIGTYTLASGSTADVVVTLCDNMGTSFIWNAGPYDNEAGFELFDPEGNSLYAFVAGEAPLNGVVYFIFFTECPSPLSQDIVLSQGWNAWSSYLTPAPPADISDVMASVVDDMLLTQHFGELYYPEYGVNTIGAFSNNHGYLTKMTAEATLTITGDMADPTIQLNAGWNLISVLQECSILAEGVFSNMDGFEIAWEPTGNGIYYPEEDLYTLTNLIPGKAYYVKVTQAGSFTYPGCDKSTGNVFSAPLRTANTTSWNDVTYTGVNHVVVFDSKATNNLRIGDMIGAFANGSLCAGLVEYTGANLGFTLFGDDMTTMANEGFTDGDVITYKVFRAETGEEFTMDVVYSMDAPNSSTFVTHGLSVITDLKLAPLSIGESMLRNLSIYPNPSTGIFNIAVSGLDTQINYVVMNAQGQEVYNGNLLESQQLDLSNEAKGIYFIKFISESVLRVEKLVVK